MPQIRWQFLIILILFLSCQTVLAQAASSPSGILYVNGRVKTGTKTVLLKKKRFYLFHGGLDANRALIDKLKAAKVTSRDCFYCQMHASPQFMDWLKADGGNCDSPFCREVKPEDIEKVPEFKAALEKGSKQFNKKPAIAQKWLLTSLDKGLLTGFYQNRKTMVDELLKGAQPVQAAMTDNGGSVQAIFVNVPLKSAGSTEKFVFSNVIPVELGQKSYVWACEIEMGGDKLLVKAPILDAPESSKVVKKCEVIVRDLQACNAGGCAKK